MSTSTDPTRTPRSLARCALAAALISAFDGTQPMLRQSPPIRWLSTSATLAVLEGQRAGRRAGQTGGRAKWQNPHRPLYPLQKPSLSPRVQPVIATLPREYPLGFDRP